MTPSSQVLGSSFISLLSDRKRRARLYFRKKTDANTWAGNTSGDNGWKYVEASNAASPFSFTTNYSQLQSALVAGDTIQYFVVAQDLAGKCASYWEGFTGLDWGPVSPSTRTHAVLWTGWVESARLQAAHGIRLNHDYYHIGPMFRDEQGHWLAGYFTGSGLPMRFVDEQARLLTLYQQLTQLADDHLLRLHWDNVAGLSAEDALAVARPMLDRGLSDHSVVTMQFHTDPYAQPEPHYTQAVRWLERSLTYARSNGIPIWNSLEWLQFWEARHAAVLQDFEWDAENKRLSFLAEVDRVPGADLALMVPASQPGALLSQVLVDGQPAKHQARELRGDQYRWVSLAGGKQRITVIYH